MLGVLPPTATGSCRRKCRDRRFSRRGARQGTAAAAVAAFRGVARGSGCLPRAHHLPGGAAVLHRPQGRRRHSRARAHHRAVPGAMDRRADAVDQRPLHAVAVRERARRRRDHAAGRGAQVRAARGPRHRPHRHPRHRHGRDRRRACAGVRQHAVLLSRHGERYGRASGRCGGRSSSARWRPRTAAISTASPWTARAPPMSAR